MRHISESPRLAQIGRNIQIIGADPVTQKGFTMVPNFILTNKELSVGAKLAYAMLLKYAWSDSECFPGQQTLAVDMGSGERSVRTYLKELEGIGALEVVHRGQGQTNIYKLHIKVKALSDQGRRPRPANFAGQDRQ